MPYILKARKCKACGEEFVPTRRDKLFCDQACKNDFHNNQHRNQIFVQVKRARQLLKNERILGDCIQKQATLNPVISKEILQHYGYEFNLFTEVNKNQKTGEYIKWMYACGLEQLKGKDQFTIHLRTKL